MKNLFIGTYVQFFFLLVPFCIAGFLSLSTHLSRAERKKAALQTSIAVLITTFILYIFGQHIFTVLGITLDAFRIGAGSVVFLSGISLINGNKSYRSADPEEDFTIVPLAIPITVGPGTIGALMVLSFEVTTLKPRLIVSAALLLVIITMTTLIISADFVEKVLGAKGLAVLSKLSGLVLATLGAQIVFTGIHNFLK